jgi:transposase InsO family protein
VVARWRQAVRDGLTVGQAAEAVKKPLSTLYRRRASPRVPTPFVGPGATPSSFSPGFEVSVSTVGRILVTLVKRGVVPSVPSLRKGSRHAPRRHKRTYAKRLPKGAKPTRPGEIVQVDTVHINLVPGKSIRHFTGYCPVARWTVAEARNRATAAAASLFLDKLQADMPFTVEGIQVDGGSEFMAEFETECEKRKIKLFVLPPRSPKLNGGVERCNGAWRYEFYACTDLPGSVEQLNPLIDDWQETYNFVRPHGALSGLTPAEYLLNHQATGDPHLSQMS